MDWKHLNLEYEPRQQTQLDTIKLLASSASLQEVADKRMVSYRTIQDSLCRLYRNTGARDRFELCIWAIKKGYVNIQ